MRFAHRCGEPWGDASSTVGAADLAYIRHSILILCKAAETCIVQLLVFVALAIAMIVPDWQIQIPVVVAALAFYLLLQSRALAEEKRALALTTGK